MDNFIRQLLKKDLLIYAILSFIFSFSLAGLANGIINENMILTVICLVTALLSVIVLLISRSENFVSALKSAAIGLSVIISFGLINGTVGQLVYLLTSSYSYINAVTIILALLVSPFLLISIVKNVEDKHSVFEQISNKYLKILLLEGIFIVLGSYISNTVVLALLGFVFLVGIYVIKQMTKTHLLSNIYKPAVAKQVQVIQQIFQIKRKSQ